MTAPRQFRLTKRHTTDFFRRLQLGLKLVLLLSRGSLFNSVKAVSCVNALVVV